MKTIILTLLLCSTSVFADGNGKEGGDPSLTNKADVYLFLDNEAKVQLAKTIESILTSEVAEYDKEFQSQVRSLKASGILEDITQSSYTFEKSCFDKNGELKGAVTAANEVNASVCWSIDFLVKNPIKASDLVGLAFHEHIHHFGFSDTDHTMASRFKKYFQLLAKGDGTLVQSSKLVQIGSDGVAWLPTNKASESNWMIKFYAFEAKDENADFICRALGFKSSHSYSTLRYFIIGANGSSSKHADIEDLEELQDQNHYRSGIVANVGSGLIQEMEMSMIRRNGSYSGKVIKNLKCR